MQPASSSRSGGGSGNDPEPSPGDVLGGRYELLGLLGRGGMASVYRGRDLRLQRTVAVKVFRGGVAEAVDLGPIRQEMHLLAGFDHPSVVAVLDASTGDGVFGPHLVMEYVAGDDLGAMLHAARGPLSADFARRIVADVAEALQALHDKGVVHRDVKPANILVPKRGSSSQVTAKLTDFGIAQVVDDDRTAGGESVLGTAAYLSPEQVRGLQPRPASDVYALGLVLLEALTGRRAFPGPATESAMARLHRRPTLPDDASPALAELLSRMTALDPQQRPAAGEVAALLRTQLVGRVMRPEAAHTAPTPIAGLTPVLTPAEVDAGATAPHTASTGGWNPVPATTGTVPALHPASRRRFPTALVVTASVLAAGVAAVAISAAAGIGVGGADPSSPAAGSSAAPSGPAQAVQVAPVASTPSTPPSASSRAASKPSASSSGSSAAASAIPSASSKPAPGLKAPVAPSASAPASSAPASVAPAPVSSAPSADPSASAPAADTDPGAVGTAVSGEPTN